MADILTRRPSARHAMSLDVRPRPARAHVNAVDSDPACDWRHLIGTAIGRAVDMTYPGSRKEAAAAIGVDEAELSRWISGERRPQFDRLFAVERLAARLVLALVELFPDLFATRTTIELRRSA